MAPQLTAMKGKRAPALRSWMVWATTSLPLPDSPTMRTVAVVGATLAIRRYTSCIGGEPPKRSPKRAGAGADAARVAAMNGKAMMLSVAIAELSWDIATLPEAVNAHILGIAAAPQHRRAAQTAVGFPLQ